MRSVDSLNIVFLINVRVLSMTPYDKSRFEAFWKTINWGKTSDEVEKTEVL